MTELRLLVTPKCNRNCAGCCNKQYDLSALPVESSFADYSKILLTGGEPMLYPDKLDAVVSAIRIQNADVPIVMYTAHTENVKSLLRVLRRIDGITLTLHEQSDLAPFLAFNAVRYALAGRDHRLRGKTMRLNVFSNVQLSPKDCEAIEIGGWQVKDNMEWIDDCPLPEDEVFKRLEF